MKVGTLPSSRPVRAAPREDLSPQELKAAAREVAEEDPLLRALDGVAARNLEPASNLAAVVALQLGGLATGLLFAFSSLPPALSALPLAASVPIALGVRYAVRHLGSGRQTRTLESQTADFYRRTRELRGVLEVQKAGTLEALEERLQLADSLFAHTVGQAGIPREVTQSARASVEACRRRSQPDQRLEALGRVNGYVEFVRHHAQPDPELSQTLRRLDRAVEESQRAAGVYNQLALIHNLSLAMPFQMTMAKVLGFEQVEPLDLGPDVRDPGFQEVLEMFQQARSPDQTPRIRVSEDHVQVGAIQLPVRRPSRA